MSIVTYTRAAKCKDCNNLRYYYIGKLKRHKCVRFNINRCMNDSICKECNLETDWNPTSIPNHINHK